jgi:hypothetical protein
VITAFRYGGFSVKNSTNSIVGRASRVLGLLR